MDDLVNEQMGRGMNKQVEAGNEEPLSGPWN